MFSMTFIGFSQRTVYLTVTSLCPPRKRYWYYRVQSDGGPLFRCSVIKTTEKAETRKGRETEKERGSGKEQRIGTEHWVDTHRFIYIQGAYIMEKKKKKKDIIYSHQILNCTPVARRTIRIQSALYCIRPENHLCPPAAVFEITL